MAKASVGVVVVGSGLSTGVMVLCVAGLRRSQEGGRRGTASGVGVGAGLGGGADLVRRKRGKGRREGMIEGVGAASARHRGEGGEEHDGG